MSRSCGALYLLPLLLQGCFLFTASEPATSVLVQREESGERNPLSVEIEQEGNDGKRLYVKGRVRAESSVPLGGVVVHLTSLHNADIIGEAYYPLAAATNGAKAPLLPAGGDVPFSISVDSDGMTDYQVELLWGEEGASFIKAAAPADSLRTEGGIRVENVSASNYEGNCEQAGCAGTAFVTASIVNNSPEPVDKVLLGLAIADGAEMESFEITGLKLSPSASRPVSIQVDIPEGGLMYKPSLAVLDPAPPSGQN